jgi:hypothetical protein
MDRPAQAAPSDDGCEWRAGPNRSPGRPSWAAGTATGARRFSSAAAALKWVRQVLTHWWPPDALLALCCDRLPSWTDRRGGCRRINDGGESDGGSEAALARLCGPAPIPVSSGTTTRYRLHRGGDRQGEFCDLPRRGQQAALACGYPGLRSRRTAEGKTKKEVIRCLKRAVVREIYTAPGQIWHRKTRTQPNRRSINRSLTMHRSIHSQCWRCTRQFVCGAN